MLQKTHSLDVLGTDDPEGSEAALQQGDTFEYLLPDASFLLFGAFSQAGFDLRITNSEGITHTVADYYSYSPSPNLVIESGAGLTPSMVKSLFPRAFGSDIQFAGPAPSGAALIEIGTVKLVVGTVTVRHADGSEEAVIKGSVLYQGDVLITAGGSFVKAEMRDGTKFQLGQNGEAVLDKYEFIEADDVGRFEATVRVGGFYYKSGKIGEVSSASSQVHTTFNTPTSIIGVRGSELEGAVDSNGETVVVHRSGVLVVTDINGLNEVVLDTPGNTALVVFNGTPVFSVEPSVSAQQALQSALPPADDSTAEEEAVEADQEGEELEEAVDDVFEDTEAETEADQDAESGQEVAEEQEEDLEETDTLDADDESDSDDGLGTLDSDALGDTEQIETQTDQDTELEDASSSFSTFTNPNASLNSLNAENKVVLETLGASSVSADSSENELLTFALVDSSVQLTPEAQLQIDQVIEPEVILPDNAPIAAPDELVVQDSGVIDVTALLLGNDSDPDAGQILQVMSASSSRADAISAENGVVRFQPNQSVLQSLTLGETSTETFSYTIESGTLSASAEVVVIYQGSNDAPVALDDQAFGSEDDRIILDVLANDTDLDVNDSLVIVEVDTSSTLGTVEIAADGQSLIYLPPQFLSSGVIEDEVHYTISDGILISSAVVLITVEGRNDAPVIRSDPEAFTIELGASDGDVTIPIEAIFTDADVGSSLTVIALDTSLTQGSVRLGSVIYNPGAAFDYLNQGQVAFEQFGIEVQDELGQVGQGVFTFQISGVNDGPVALDNTATVRAKDEITPAIASSVLADDADVDGDALTVSAIRSGGLEDPSGLEGSIGILLTGTYGALTLNADGSYSYAAKAGAADALPAGVVAEDVFTYTVTDGTLSDRAELRIMVTGVNDAPVALANMAAVLENETIVLASESSVLADDADIDGDALSVVGIRSGGLEDTDGIEGIVGSAITGTYGTLMLNADGSYSYAATAGTADALADGVTAEDVFTYTVTDGTLSDRAELRITVTGVNDAPVAVSISTAVVSSSASSLDSIIFESSILVDDPDPDDDVLLVETIRSGELEDDNTNSEGTVGIALDGNYGTLILNADGSYRYATTVSAVAALPEGVSADDVFTYSITDGAAADSAELRIRVMGVNDGPVALDNTATVRAKDEITPAIASSVLADDADVDGDALTVSAIRSGGLEDPSGLEGSIGILLTGTYGALTLNADGSYSYAAKAGAADALPAGVVAEDVFTYTVTDGTLSDRAELRIMVTGVNDAPVALANMAAVLENETIVLASESSVLADDADIDGDALSVVGIRSGGLEDTDGIEGIVGSAITGTYGTLMLNADGSYSYAATAGTADALADGVTAEDVFTYTVTDGTLSDRAELRITVTGVNDQAVFAVAATDYSVTRNAAFDNTAFGTIGIVDADQSQSVLASAEAQYGSVKIGPDSTWTYTLDNSNRVVEASVDGDVLLDTITFTSLDGSYERVSITIYTTNLPARLTVELSDLQSTTLVIGDIDNAILSGQVSFTDNEGAVLLPIAASYGTVEISEESWIYRIDDQNMTLLGLDDGETVLEQIIFRSDDAQDLNDDGMILDLDRDQDGALDLYEGRQIVFVELLGRNDSPIVDLDTVQIDQFDDQIIASSEATGILQSVVDPDNQDGSVSDILSVSGVRLGGNQTVGAFSSTGLTLSGFYGELTVQSDGSYQYILDQDARDNALENAEAVEDVFTIAVTDGSETVSSELRFRIDNVSPIAIDGDVLYRRVNTDTPTVRLTYTDIDALTLTLQTLDELPNGLSVSTVMTGTGGEIQISGVLDPSVVSLSGMLSSDVGDYLLESNVNDGDNLMLIDRFILSVRSPNSLSVPDATYEFIKGESDYVSAYVDPNEYGSFVFVNLWEPNELGDRLAVFGNVAVIVYSEDGAVLTVEGAAQLDLNNSPGADLITLKGIVDNLSLGGISALDTLVNQTTILASPGQNDFQLQNEGYIRLTSNGLGTRAEFDDSEAGVVGETLSDPLIYGETTQTKVGRIFLVPDNDPAAPYLILSSLNSAGEIFVTGYSGYSVSQPSVLEISRSDVPSIMTQSASGSITLSSGGALVTGELTNGGVIRLVNNSHDGVIVGGAGSAGHLIVSGTYLEDGRLISQSAGQLIKDTDPNELSVGSMVLTGTIEINADLFLSNVNQSLDWRDGLINLAHSADLMIAGGSLIVGSDTLISGFGNLSFGSASSLDNANIVLVVDGEVSTQQFSSPFWFDEARVVIAPQNGALFDTLTISRSDEWLFDDELVNVSFQIEGVLNVSGGTSTLVGDTVIGPSGLVRLQQTTDASTGLQVEQSLENLGRIDIRLGGSSPLESDVRDVIPVTQAFYSGETGDIVIVTPDNHGLQTGDKIALTGVIPTLYNYVGEITVLDAVSFTFAAVSDPGEFQSGGEVSVFGTVIGFNGGLNNLGYLSIQDTVSQAQSTVSGGQNRILIEGNITNSLTGSLLFKEGQINVQGDILNQGLLTISGQASDSTSTPNGYPYEAAVQQGATLILDGNLLLAETSILQLKVDESESNQWVIRGLELVEGAWVSGTDGMSGNLGTLVLNFSNSSVGATLQSSGSVRASWSQELHFALGANFDSVASNLAAGYEITLSPTVSLEETNRQTIEVVISDLMTFESLGSGLFDNGDNWLRIASAEALPSVNDDVRITHQLSIASGTSIVLNSLSLEVGPASAEAPASYGSLSLLDDQDDLSETTSFTLNEQSTIAEGSLLSMGSSTFLFLDTIQFTLADQLSVHGSLVIGSSSIIDGREDGKIIVSSAGIVEITDDPELNLSIEVERGGLLRLTGYYSEEGLNGSGDILNAGVIDVEVNNGVGLGIDIVNHGVMTFYFGQESAGAFELTAGSETTIATDGLLIASSFRESHLILNDNTLDARGGELALFVHEGANGAYGLTLAGGGSILEPGRIKLQETDFSVSPSALSIEVIEEAAGAWTVYFRVSRAIADQFLEGPEFTTTVTGGTIDSESWGGPTFMADGSVVYSASLIRDSLNTGDIVITVLDEGDEQYYFGGALTIAADGSSNFHSSLGDTGKLTLVGHLQIDLTGIVEFSNDDQISLTLDGRTADSILLANDSSETSGLRNSQTIHLSNLTLDDDVFLINGDGKVSDLGQSPVLTISGVSVLQGDLYNIGDAGSENAQGNLYLLDSVTFNGNVVQQAGAQLWIGYDPVSDETRSTEVVFSQDFNNEGWMLVGSVDAASDFLIKVGEAEGSGVFTNSGYLEISANTGNTTIDGVLNNVGTLLVSGQLTLDPIKLDVEHHSEGVLSLRGDSAGLTLGESSTLVIGQTGYLGTNGGTGAVVIDGKGSGASIVIGGYLGIGDTIEATSDGVNITTGLGSLQVNGTEEVVIESGSTIKIDASFGASSSRSDELVVSGGNLRLGGGRIEVTSAFSAAGASLAIMTAPSILGSIDTIDGLILTGADGRSLLDVDQTGTAIRLTPIADTSVLKEGSSDSALFDFDAAPNLTHYLAGSGNDLIVGLDIGDTAYGEEGDDSFVLDALLVQRIDGGAGVDQVFLPDVTTFDFTKDGSDNVLGTPDDWLGQRFERIELLSMEDATNQTMALDASALRSINDGANGLLNDEAGLVVKGNIGDVINLSGDFDYTEDRFAQMRTAVESSSGSAVTMTYAPELFTGVSDGAVSLFFDQDVLVNVTHTNAGVSRYGHSGDDVLAGSSLGGETLAGRGGDDQLDALAGADRQLGGDGNDSIVFDSADLEMDGGNGVDTLLLSGSVDFSQLDQLANFEQVDMSGNNSADSLSLTFADVFELVGDNSLDAYVPANDHKVLVINGDSEDALILNGVDIRNQTAVQTGIDLYGDGTTYALFQDTDLGVDVYVLSDLLSGASPSGSEKVSEPVMAAPTFDQYLYEPSADHFGGL